MHDLTSGKHEKEKEKQDGVAKLEKERWKKSSSFWAARWAVRLRRKKEKEGRKLWRQHHWEGAKGKMHLWMITEGKRNSSESINRQFKISKEITLVSLTLKEHCRGRTQRKSNLFSFLRSFFLDTLWPRVFRYINTKYDTPPPWPNKKGFVPKTVGFNVAASEAARGLLKIYSTLTDHLRRILVIS